MLISFDLREEEFQIIPFPDDHDREEFGATSATTIINWRLFMWNERVTLLRNVASLSLWPPNSDAKPMRMWLLDEIAGGYPQKTAFCWTKYADLLSGGNLRYFPVVFWRNDELLCFTYQKGLVSCNLRTKKLRIVELDPAENGYFHAFVYVESLVSIEGAKKMI
ncbi:hypothetical protein TIFTF001_000959 [Ficus carica]|uniref:F-box associated domain-containing protein n=1 Tax=Ficus carica TaxID=3494 RepID=A0AA87Z4Z7_FICCA|nr:hypothetical protein TIFTF001_000959 [Ficus carica]